MSIHDAMLKVGDATVFGATAEVISVLSDSCFWNEISDSPNSLKEYVHVLDTRSPAEERVSHATGLIRSIQSRRILARWIPWYSSLANHEFSNQFYPAYRDHSIHTLQVFLLGLYLYETVEGIRQKLDDRLSTIGEIRYNAKDLFLEWWTLSSLWHDSGYPFESNNFVNDASARARQLSLLSTGLGDNIFQSGLIASGLTISEADVRTIYQAGRYYPLKITNVGELLDSVGTPAVIDNMWRRLGVGVETEYVTKELDRITTQSPVGRPPYHDHGLLGGLMLGLLASETRTFLSHLADSPERTKSPLMAKVSQVALDAWVNAEALSGLVDWATEAIAFHNLTFKQIDPSERQRLLGGGNLPDAVTLNSEPHLFFLALVDTLQDWDRHHFVPQTKPPTYRSAVRASDMLLQGKEGKIRISIKGKTKSVDQIYPLFHEWLSSPDISALFVDGAQYSRPDIVHSGELVPITTQSASKAELERLETFIKSSVISCRTTLLKDAADSVIIASSHIQDVYHQINRAKTIMTSSDWNSLDSILDKSGIRQLERQSNALIQQGTKLPLGIVQTEIGDGGFGIVYYVQARESGVVGNEYAFKLFHNRDLQNIEKRKLFRRGYDAMKRLNGHPNIVRVFDFSDIPVGFYMEYIKGSSLDKGGGLLQLNEVPISKIEAALAIAETLSYTHQRGILHRDIKPGNIILDSTQDFKPILTDFDLAYLGGQSTHVGFAYASQAYGAPEQFNDRLHKERKEPTVDVYSFGALLYYMLSSQDPPFNRPIEAANLTELETRLIGTFPAVTVNELLAIIQECTKQNPAERIHSMEDVVRRLSKCVTYARSSKSSLSQQDWFSEIQYRIVGTTGFNGNLTFVSRTQGTTWAIDKVKSASGKLYFTASCRLNGDPRHEGVNYDGYRRTTVRQVDSRLSEFEKGFSGITAERHGQIRGAGSSLNIEFKDVPMTMEAADGVGHLLASVSRIVE